MVLIEHELSTPEAQHGRIEEHIDLPERFINHRYRQICLASTPETTSTAKKQRTNMSNRISHEIDPDDTSIREVLLCWESGQEDDNVDFVHMIPKIGDRLDPIVNIIPESPRIESHAVVQGDGESLERLMLKYPSFVPKSIPKIPSKRTRPLCLFVNYMGTRAPTKIAEKVAPEPEQANSKTLEASPSPTDAPSLAPRPTKKPRMAPASTTTRASQSQLLFDVSPMPTLGPTSTILPVSLTC